MKIDIHAHTKKTKKGDPMQRNIDPEMFATIIKATNVKILAITNHNHFDINQYNAFVDKTGDICQLWPGVELDVCEGGRRGHLIVIVNPLNIELLHNKMNELLAETNEDEFNISIEDTVRHFDGMDAIYIAHYHSKKPNLIDCDIDKLTRLIKNKNRVIKEATNSISAGIYISHGHKSIYGSDVKRWNDYLQISEGLPDLRLPVESFEQFCLLLDKDDPTIIDLLDKKKHETISISPFGADEEICLPVYDDINILFGSKGTGKTEILRAISQHYNGIGLKTHVYESNLINLSDVFDIKGNKLTVKMEDFGIESCKSEIQLIKSAKEVNITSMSRYRAFHLAQQTNERANRIAIQNFSPLDIDSLDRELKKMNETLTLLDEFIAQMEKKDDFRGMLESNLYDEFVGVLSRVRETALEKIQLKFLEARSTQMFNNLIKCFVKEISRKTGKPSKPIKTGFRDYASNRIRIERATKKIIKNMGTEIDTYKLYVGDLGEKGKLYCQTKLLIQDGTISNSKFNPLKRINKTPLKEFPRGIKEIYQSVYSNDLFERVADLMAIQDADDIEDIEDLILFYRHFAVNDQTYTPSSGESSMVMLHRELSEDKDIYLLDEPEKSLGNDYINDVIVPILKERAEQGKKIIIATHDANIAVRTLPYNSIYRNHGPNGYGTYIGNPFSNNLIGLCSNDLLDWKEISMKTLEGGREAFGERGKIYGNI
jgi:predicted ATPase